MNDFQRFHHLRSSADARSRYAEYTLRMTDLVWPIFVQEGHSICSPIKSLEGMHRWSPDRVHEAAAAARELGVDKVLLFPVIDPATKDAQGSRASDPEGPVPLAIRELRRSFPDLTIIADVCLCAYTDHGHCGLLQQNHSDDSNRHSDTNNTIDNDRTIELLASSACCFAAAGAHIVAPSAMMDGQVAAIRTALDGLDGLNDPSGAPPHSTTRIMSYSAKFASTLYGPFRDAADSSPSHGDRKAYQMDYRCRVQALSEIQADLNEGADIVMVKPASWYQDILDMVHRRHPTSKLAAYHVSGEYMMLKYGAQNGLFNFSQAYLEALTGLKRAGADWIITYGIKEIADALA